MDIKPIGERILITPVKEEEKTSGGIYIPESAKEKKKQGKVVAVGIFKDGKPLSVNVGDTILYGGYSSDEFQIDNVDYVMLDFKDVLAKLN